jgi:hypothetical protein
LRKGIWLFLVLVAAIVVPLIAFWASSTLQQHTVPASNVTPVSPHYLRTVPDLYGNSSETNIFLVAADNPRYGCYNESYQRWDGGEVHTGDPCFIIDITVRNDYTLEQPPPGGLTPYGSSIILTTYLYSQQGAVYAADVTYPITFHGGHEFNLNIGETKSFDMYLATTNRNIDHYEILIRYLYSMPEP